MINILNYKQLKLLNYLDNLLFLFNHTTITFRNFNVRPNNKKKGWYGEQVTHRYVVLQLRTAHEKEKRNKIREKKIHPQTKHDILVYTIHKSNFLFTIL